MDKYDKWLIASTANDIARRAYTEAGKHARATEAIATDARTDILGQIATQPRQPLALAGGASAYGGFGEFKSCTTQQFGVYVWVTVLFVCIFAFVGLVYTIWWIINTSVGRNMTHCSCEASDTPADVSSDLLRATRAQMRARRI